MDNLEFVNLNLSPFQEEWEELEALLLEDEWRLLLALKLGFAYFDKLVGRDLHISFPDISILKVNKNLQNLYDTIEYAGGALMSFMLDWSSFHMELINMDEVETLTEIDWDTWLQMDNASRKEKLLEYQNNLFSEPQMELIQQMPDPVLNSMDFQSSRTAIYLFSKKLSDYLLFADHNRYIIDNQFSQEHRQLQNAVSSLQFPIRKGWEGAEILNGASYIIGFYFGAAPDEVISYKDLDWNFFVALYVLEKILKLAEDLFDFTAEVLEDE